MKLKYISLLSILTIYCCQSLFAQNPIIERGIHLKGILKTASKIYLAPSSSSAENSTAERFTPVFLFETDDGERTKNGYYRVGKSPENTDGWIHKNYIQPWDHRLCLTFTSMIGRKPALIFKNYTDVSSDGSHESWKSKAASVEPNSIKDPKEYDMLLPVLEQKRIGASNQRNSKIYKIGYLTGTNNIKYSQPKPQGKTRLDLMFLLESGEQIDAIKNGLHDVMSTLSRNTRGMQNAEIRYGLMTYGNNRSSYTTKKHLPLTTSPRSFLEELKTLNIHSSSSYSSSKMYEGIYHAIHKTKWTTRNDIPSLRVVVLVGATKVDEDKTIIDRMDLIQDASEKRVRFIGLKVITGNELNDRIHKEELEAFVEGAENGDKGYYSDIYLSNYKQKLKQSLENEIERLMLLEKIKNGNLTNNIPSDRTIILKNMPASGIPSSDLHYQTGWVNENQYNGSLQVEPYVFMTRDELNLLIWYMQTAIATVEASDNKKIAQVMAERISAMTGIKYTPSMNLEEHVQRKLGLPKKHSGLLDFSLAEMSTWSETRKKNMAKFIRTKRRNLDNHLSDDNWRQPTGSGFQYTFIPLSLLP